MCKRAESLSRYSDWLRAGRSGDRIPVGARFSAPVQTGPGAQPAPCIMGTGSFPGVKSGRGVTLTPQPLLVPRSRKTKAITLLPQWAVRPVQSLSACIRVNITFYLVCKRTLESPRKSASYKSHKTTLHRSVTGSLTYSHQHMRLHDYDVASRRLRECARRSADAPSCSR